MAGAAVFVSYSAVQVEGGAGLSGPGSASAPLVGGLTGLHNSSSWPVWITSISSDDAEFSYSLTDSPEGGGLIEPTEWITPGNAVQLAPGQSMLVFLSLAPADDNPSTISSLDVQYSSLFGLSFTQHTDALSMLAYPEGTPDGAAAVEYSSEGLEIYIRLVLAALAQSDVDHLASVMGSTADEASAFRREQAGVSENMGWTINHIAGSGDEVAFFVSNSAVDSLAPFTVTFAHHHWSVAR